MQNSRPDMRKMQIRRFYSFIPPFICAGRLPNDVHSICPFHLASGLKYFYIIKQEQMKTLFYISTLLTLCLCSCTGGSFLQQRYTHFSVSKTKKANSNQYSTCEKNTATLITQTGEKSLVQETETKEEPQLTSVLDEEEVFKTKQNDLPKQTIMVNDKNIIKTATNLNSSPLKKQISNNSNITTNKKQDQKTGTDHFGSILNVLKSIAMVILIIISIVVLIYLGAIGYILFLVVA